MTLGENMKKIKTGIIGCGKVADIHAMALQNIEESEFTAVYCRKVEKGKKFAEKYGVKAYTNITDMINECGIEAVIVVTPHPAHADPTIEAIEGGAHAMVEKPLASSLEDCDLMITAAKRKNVKLSVISQRRCYAPAQRIKKAIDDGKLGQTVLGTVNMLSWRDKDYYDSDPWRGTWEHEGGGVLVNQAPHQLDLLLWYLGEIDELYGVWANLNHPYIEVEDTSIAVIRFKNGALGNIIVSNSQNPALYGKVAVHGANGASVGVQTDGGAMFIAGMSTVEEPPLNDLWTIPGEDDRLEAWKKEDTEFFKKINPVEYYHELQIQDFIQAIIDDREPMISAEDGRKTVELFTAIYRSQNENQVIKFPLSGNQDF
jgi:predicted dehydrogenase